MLFVNITDFDLLGMYAEHAEPNVALLEIHFDLTLFIYLFIYLGKDGY